MIDNSEYEAAIGTISIVTLMSISSYLGRVIGDKFPADITPEREINSQIGGYIGMFIGAILCSPSRNSAVSPLSSLAAVKISKLFYEYKKHCDLNILNEPLKEFPPNSLSL